MAAKLSILVSMVTLTNTSYQQIGRAFFPIPINFNTSSPSNDTGSFTFSTSFVFSIVPEFPDLGGHGITFIITPSMELKGDIASQYLGLFNITSNGLSSNHVFAVKLDTIKSPEFNDIDGNHVGIDVNSLKSYASASASYYSDRERDNKTLKLISGKVIQLWIDYDQKEMLLNVTAAPLRTPKPWLPLLSARLDLSTTLLEPMYVGFSASTGSMSSDQYILGWSFNITTKGFKGKELLGIGSFGEVYKGILPSSNEEVAVKRVFHSSKQGMKEFIAEIASMGSLRHRNLVQLLGYCRRQGELLLVYDFIANGSLDKFLFINEKRSLDWSQRIQILKGVASALVYLHEEWDQVVIHRDIKASNVLLDAQLNGRLRDFGLAKFYDHGSNPQTTRHRRPFEPGRPSEEIILVDWVLEFWKTGMILQMSDPRLEGEYVVEEMELILKLGLLWANPAPETRPSMRKVVQYLDGM
ncbi:L-type lectin-domain containing receptor kinase IV.1 [Hibiscus syriacus]|uniref:L-type lectin-domain containing receptor kinase IV.1 n=1 Tax=Hibiscus syriacus TaxID=106335 RepID=A0A6A3CK91_HIBSY|nr:L-type lectin-domain containing receptor kinase IV.1 [Hibiscus syriacus]